MDERQIDESSFQWISRELNKKEKKVKNIDEVVYINEKRRIDDKEMRLINVRKPKNTEEAQVLKKE